MRSEVRTSRFMDPIIRTRWSGGHSPGGKRRRAGRGVASPGMSAWETPGRQGFGDLLRYWRRVRAMSQLDLAAAASTTPRYMSFVETGRSRPSREMVLRLATALDVPLRDRNGLLVAAGFASIYPEHDLDHPAIDRVMAALDRVLDQHAPYPAVVMDRRWDVVRVNRGAAHLFAGLCAPDPVPDPANVLRMMLEPGPVRTAVENWDQVAPSLLERARREAVGGVLDLVTADLVQRLRTGPDAAVFAAAPRSITPLVPVIDVHFNFDESTLRWFSVVSTIGTPVDITAQELRLEAFFPSDDATAARWRRISSAAAR
jgi:transcriptional regulator with XRE-family HTH domain